jgi:hypothetical protein
VCDNGISADWASASQWLGRLSVVVTHITLMALTWHPAHASGKLADPDGSMFSFSGFGTAGLVRSSEDQADFTENQLQANGAGHTRQWSPTVDSRLGLQLTGHFTSQLSIVLQAISEQNDDGTYRPHAEWANLMYEATPDISIRVGRILLPTFLLSEFRKVGYANPWVRPPLELYSLSSVSNNDGVDASYRVLLGDFTNTVAGTYGRTQLGVPGGGRFDAKNGWLITDTLDFGATTVHIGYQKATLSLRLSYIDELFAALRQFGPQGVAIADRYDPDNKTFTIMTVGATYNPGSWFAMGEWGRRKTVSMLGDSSAWYASVGYRLAQFTPYLTYGQVVANSNTSDPGLSESAFPAFLRGNVDALNAGLDAALATIGVQNTISVGTRWDCTRNIDVKLQYDRSHLGANSTGLLVNEQPGLRRGGTLNVFSVALDFVF